MNNVAPVDTKLCPHSLLGHTDAFVSMYNAPLVNKDPGGLKPVFQRAFSTHSETVSVPMWCLSSRRTCQVSPFLVGCAVFAWSAWVDTNDQSGEDHCVEGGSCRTGHMVWNKARGAPFISAEKAFHEQQPVDKSNPFSGERMC